MTTKLYLICEDIDLGYHVNGVYDKKKRAESKLKEYLDVWVKTRFFNEEIPEELLTEDGLINAYNWHHHYIKEMEMNSDEIMDRSINDSRNYLKRLAGDTIEKQIEWHRSFIKLLECQETKEDEILLYRNTLKNLEAKKETQNDKHLQ